MTDYIYRWDGQRSVAPIQKDLLTALAVMFAQPLRNAFRRHLEEHYHPRGFGECTEAMDLFNLLPAGDRGLYIND